MNSWVARREDRGRMNRWIKPFQRLGYYKEMMDLKKEVLEIEGLVRSFDLFLFPCIVNANFEDNFFFLSEVEM